MLLCRVLFASTVYALLHQHVKELIWGTNPQRAITSPTPWFYWELGNYHPLGNEYLLITPTFKMLKMPEWKYGVFSCNLVSFIKIIEKDSLVLWIPPFQFFFLWKFSNGSHTTSSQIISLSLRNQFVLHGTIWHDRRDQTLTNTNPGTFPKSSSSCPLSLLVFIP